MEMGKVQLDRLGRGLAFVGLGLFFGRLLRSGQIRLLLKPGISWMTGASATILILLGLSQLLRLIRSAADPERDRPLPEHERDAHSHREETDMHVGNGWLPAVIAFLFIAISGMLTPLAALDADAAIHRGLKWTAGQPSAQKSGDNFLSQIDQAFHAGPPGRQVDLIGFVARWRGLDSDEFILTRFEVSCCAADAVPVGVKVVWPAASEFPGSAWVRVRGRAMAESRQGSRTVVIYAEDVIRSAPPASPYLYPGH